ncbi:hypothetical protein U1Q18_028578, partial [Sarracenia purpurea var. burkii]
YKKHWVRGSDIVGGETQALPASPPRPASALFSRCSWFLIRTDVKLLHGLDLAIGPECLVYYIQIA